MEALPATSLGKQHVGPLQDEAVSVSITAEYVTFG